MFERFTERARQVVVLAQEEARELRHSYIGTEHELLGLLREEQGLAAAVLDSLGVTVEAVRDGIKRIVGPGDDVVHGQIPFTPRAKKVLELALREALSLRHNYIGTEHILLGLVRENEGVAMRILLDLNVTGEQIRDGVIRAMSGGAAAGRAQSGQPSLTHLAEYQLPSRDAGEMLSRIERQIQVFLGREPDNGDLLVILSALPEGVVARTLSELGIDAVALDAALARAREAGPDDIDDQIARAQERKDAALDEGRMEDAARERDEERRLVTAREADLLGRIRERLGLSAPPAAGTE